jgi:AcrR family transcriptional regulator
MSAAESAAPRAASLAKRSGSSGHVHGVQRARLIAAAIDRIDEVGYPATTVTQIISRAHVSRATFYQIFANRDDCFLVVFDETLSQAMRPAASAYAGAPSWRQGVRAALGGLLVHMEEQPALARLWIIETLRGGQRVLDRRVRALDRLARVIDEARHNGQHQPPDSTAEGILGAIVAMLHRRLSQGGATPLTDLLGPMMYLIVLPYLGVREARTELHRSTALRPWSSLPGPANADPLDGLQMRLTYRTVRVLDAISKTPRATNRKIAESSGVADEGQISKLLARLARLGLVENHGPGQKMGGANAWQLTERGEAIARSMPLSTGRSA